MIWRVKKQNKILQRYTSSNLKADSILRMENSQILVKYSRLLAGKDILRHENYLRQMARRHRSACSRQARISINFLISCRLLN